MFHTECYPDGLISKMCFMEKDKQQSFFQKMYIPSKLSNKRKRKQREIIGNPDPESHYMSQIVSSLTSQPSKCKYHT